MTTADLQKALPKVSVKPPKAPKPAKAAKQAAKALKAHVSKDGAPAPLGEAPPVWSSPWFWVSVVALLLVAVAGVWWWRNGNGKGKSEKQQKAKGPDLYADWKAFRAQLPRRLRRVLDEFQPVVVLGKAAAEKEHLVNQLSGVKDNENLFPGQVRFDGEGIDIILGARTVVLMPSETFLDSEGANSDGDWLKLLKSVSQVHTPRVLVCLSQRALESDDQDSMTNWTAKLRGHIDTIADVRDDDVPVTLVLAQSPKSRDGSGDSSKLTDAFFELMRALGSVPAYQRLLAIPFDDIKARIGVGAEQRKQDGQSWVDARLRPCQEGWPKLLAQPDQTAGGMLALAALFEKFNLITASLGIAVAELFVESPGQRYSGRGVDLRILPQQDGRFVGTLPVFEGATQQSGKWYPTGPLLHRLAVASGFCILTLGTIALYYRDKDLWLAASAAVRNYTPTRSPQDITLVEQYFNNNGNVRMGGFFDRDRLRCLAVEQVRTHLQGKIRHALEVPEAPERVLQLVSLYVTGAPNDCNIDENHPDYKHYKLLSDTIKKYIDQWRVVTGLKDEEIRAYLYLSCPNAPMDSLEHNLELFEKNAQRQRWEPVLDAGTFGRDLESVSGSCPLPPKDRTALDDAEAIAKRYSEMSSDHSAAMHVLDAISQLNTPVMRRLTEAFVPYQARLKRLAGLGEEQQVLELLKQDLLPYAHTEGQMFFSGMSPLALLEQRLEVTLRDPESEVPKVSLSADDQTFLIDRRKVRTGLQLRALEDLRQEFTFSLKRQEAAESTQEVLFFTPEEYNRNFNWTSRFLWTRGISMYDEVPWRYTLEGYQKAVQQPLADLTKLQSSLNCGVKDASGLGGLGYQLRDLIRQRLYDYLVAYGRTWNNVYNSFSLRVSNERDLVTGLESLSQPTSPLLKLVKETAKEVSLPAGDGFPFPELVSLAGQGLETLPAAADDKALQDYVALIKQLADAGRVETSPPVPVDVLASAGQAAPLDPKSSVAAFSATLSPYGQLLVSGIQDPKQELQGQVQEWAEKVQLSTPLRKPFLEPFQAAQNLGVQDVQSKLAEWWKPIERQVVSDVTLRFPFNPDSNQDADVLKVTAWLHPLEGRLNQEILPVLQLAQGCKRLPCVTIPNNISSLIAWLRRIQSTLFDEKGEPKTLKVSVEPVPFATQEESPKSVLLSVGQSNLDYFNTEPETQQLELAWSEAHTARLDVELAGKGSNAPPLPIITGKSPWAFWYLLKQAKRQDYKFTWHLENTLPGAREDVRVSLQVCANVDHCDQMLSGVLGWN